MSQSNDETLKKFNLYVNLTHKFVSCTLCQYAIGTYSWYSHANHYHRLKPSSNEIDEVNTIIRELIGNNQTNQELEQATYSGTEVPGLELFEGFGCRNCPAFFSSNKTSRGWDDHCKTPGNHQQYHCNSQTLYQSPQKRMFFKVIPTQNTERVYSDEVIQERLQLLPSDEAGFNHFIDPDVNPNPELLSAFARESNWHRIVQMFAADQLQSILFGEHSDEEAIIYSKSKEIFHQWHEKIDNAQHHLLVQIEALEIDSLRHGLKRLDQSADEYSNTFAKLILVLIRLITDFSINQPVPIPENVSIAAQSVVDNVEEDTLGENIIDLSWALFSQVENFKKPRNTFVAVVLANMLCIDELGGLKHVSFITRCLAQIIYAARLCILHMVQNSDDKEEPSIIQLCKSTVNAPIFNLWDIKRLAKKISSETPGNQKIEWVPNNRFDELRIRGNLLSLNELQLVMEKCQEDLYKLLHHNLLLGFRPDTTKFKKLKDNIDNSNSCYSFLNEVANQLQTDQLHVVRHIIKNQNLSRDFIASNDEASIQWNQERIQVWYVQCRKFVDLLIAAIHISSGQPCRGTEMATYRICNQLFDKRSLFLGKETSYLLQTYHKSRNITNTEANIPRYLDTNIHNLLLIYLVYIRPLEIYWCQIIEPDEAELPNRKQNYFYFLFVKFGRAYTDEEIRNTVKGVFIKYLNKAITFQDYRHAAIAFARYHLKLNSQIEDYLPIDEQAVHSRVTAKKLYGRETIGLLIAEDYHMHWMVSVLWRQLLGMSKDIQLKADLRVVNKTQTVSPKVQLSSQNESNNTMQSYSVQQEQLLPPTVTEAIELKKVCPHSQRPQPLLSSRWSK